MHQGFEQRAVDGQKAMGVAGKELDSFVGYVGEENIGFVEDMRDEASRFS